ncbi:MAG: hypothetical protein WCF85_13205, partial [Rhodospirillaceae bacterium]
WKILYLVGVCVKPIGMEHFFREESLMERTHYHDKTKHYAEHAKLIDTLSGIILHFELHQKEISTEALEFMKYWLQDHTTTLDVELGKYLADYSKLRRLKQ